MRKVANTINNQDIEQAVEFYSQLPYNITVEPWDDGEGTYWVARILELPHCLIHGDTPAEAIEEIEEVKRDWIKSNLERGLDIPEPISHKYSGHISLRMPAFLHRLVSERARAEGTSVNQYMVTLLSTSVGIPEKPPAVASRSKSQKNVSR